ncbi:hypothetical protein [Nodularia spumigena]|uniref:hypothetical protein n=1 Tax=Nodularia spumigena TaxID=70799 RepID=UPI002330A253|nr:hypothetical protein [Nodularia spumigena]
MHFALYKIGDRTSNNKVRYTSLTHPTRSAIALNPTYKRSHYKTSDRFFGVWLVRYAIALNPTNKIGDRTNVLGS